MGSCSSCIKGRGSRDKKVKSEIINIETKNSNPKTKEDNGIKDEKLMDLIKKNELEADFERIENSFTDQNVDSTEKLRRLLFFLKERTVPGENTLEENTSTEEFLEIFVGAVEKFFDRIFKEFSGNAQGYRPSIKILQTLELMQENFKENEKRIENKYKHIYPQAYPENSNREQCRLEGVAKII